MWDLGDEHVKQDARMAHYRDLSDLYARSLEYHGIGYALFQPVAASDMTPPCVGFFDRNGDFNLIAKLSHLPQNDGYIPLQYLPPKVADVGICWKPKTSLGVSAMTVDASGNGPDGLPASAEGHVRYSSKSSFGAVLIASRPVTLTGYNDERLFLAWLEANKNNLLDRHGKQLRKYGMWIITRTHTAPGCWINAWQSKNREAQLSLKAKANMLGGLGDEISLDDKSSDRDWTHYQAKDRAGIVVFMDGIEVTASQWTYESLKRAIVAPLSRSSSRRSVSVSRVSPVPSPQPPYPNDVADYQAPVQLSTSHHRRSSTSAGYASRRHSLSPAMAEMLVSQGQRRKSYSPSMAAARRLSAAGVPLLDDLVPPASPPPAPIPGSQFPLRPPSADDCGCGDPVVEDYGTDMAPIKKPHSAKQPPQQPPTKQPPQQPKSPQQPPQPTPQQPTQNPLLPQPVTSTSGSPHPRPRPRPRRPSQARPSSMYSAPQVPAQDRPPERPNTPGFPVAAYSESNAKGEVTLMDQIEDEMDEQVMRDLGFADTLSRTMSLTRSVGTPVSRSSSPRTPSLRRETRTILGNEKAAV